MSTKPAATSNSGRFAGLSGAVKRFSSNLSDKAVVDGGVGLFIVIALSLMLLRNYQRPQIEALPVGAIAAADIIAPDDIKPIEDTDETESARAQAASSVLPVFDFNPKATRDIRNSIEQMFAVGREGLRETSPDQLRQNIKDTTGIILDLDQVGTLIKHRFNGELERLMIDHIELVMMTGVIDRRTLLVKLGATGIERRDVKTGEKKTLTDLSSVRDLINAHASLRSDKLVLPVEYDAAERRLLGEVLSSLVIPNLVYNDEETEARKKVAEAAIRPVTISVERGKPIVKRGETVSRSKAELLRVASSYRPIGQRAIEFGGTVVIVMMLLVVLWQYLMRYQRRHLRVRRHFLLQVASFAITLGLGRLFFSLAFAISQWTAISPFNSQMAYKYLAPLAAGAALVTILTDAHAAFVFSAILAVFVGVLSGNVHLAAYTLISSVGAIYHLQNCRDRTALVRAGLWIGLVNAAAALALDLLGANEPRMLAAGGGLDAIGVVLFDASCGVMSGVLAAMVASILLPLFEWLFEITTNIKLLELSNLNLPLLKQLAERAPGTYHHSIRVGLLAEAAAEAIGGDALFARVACYYHDIGKTMRPAYFIENQTYMDNRHDNLAPKMSSIILANHVKQGIELARQYKLPPRIIAIIPQHHGTGLMKYFYYKARQAAEDPGSVALEREFRYPGPKPQTREAGIIMIADSVEAAARTVQEPTHAKLTNMIEMIIERIRNDGQLDECDITLRELKIVSDSFCKVLMGIHHHRITYPGYDFNQTGTTAASPVVKPDGYRTRAGGQEVTGELPVSREMREARGD
jgi:putative nucleotidyltransferase with HDIG domain